MLSKSIFTVNEKRFLVAVVLLFIQAELNFANKGVGIFFIDFLKGWSFTVKSIRLFIVLYLNFYFVFLH